MKSLDYCLYTANEEGEYRHPADVVRELGIRYREWHSAPMADCILLYGCENVPEELPKFIKVIGE